MSGDYDYEEYEDECVIPSTDPVRCIQCKLPVHYGDDDRGGGWHHDDGDRVIMGGSCRPHTTWDAEVERYDIVSRKWY